MRIRWRGLELPSLITADRTNLTGTYGKFVAETVRTWIRRYHRKTASAASCFSSLEGSAVTQIKLHGALHEFQHAARACSKMFADIVLNVKSLVVKNYSEQTRVVRIEKNTKGPNYRCRCPE